MYTTTAGLYRNKRQRIMYCLQEGGYRVYLKSKYLQTKIF